MVRGVVGALVRPPQPQHAARDVHNALHRLCVRGQGVASGRNTQTTKFAFPITTGMSFNRTMWQLTGRQIGVEARAMMDAGNGYSTFWAPVINLAR